MAAEVIRIFSDLHYGDHSSRLTDPRQLAPLAEGVAGWIINGDSLDNRTGPDPAFTAENRARLDGYFRSAGLPITQLTGNHDPTISERHFLELADGRIFLMHGDVLYPEIVPWGRDAGLIRQRFREEWHARPPQHPGQPTLAEEMAALRRVAAGIPQRHQSERRRSKYLARLAVDLFWPPWRSLAIVNAWRTLPDRTWRFAERHRLAHQVILTGHTHWAGLWRRRGRATLVNTGSLCRPFGGLVADLSDDVLAVREIELRAGEFHAGRRVAELRLKDSSR